MSIERCIFGTLVSHFLTPALHHHSKDELFVFSPTNPPTHPPNYFHFKKGNCPDVCLFLLMIKHKSCCLAVIEMIIHHKCQCVLIGRIVFCIAKSVQTTFKHTFSYRMLINFIVIHFLPLYWEKTTSMNKLVAYWVAVSLSSKRDHVIIQSQRRLKNWEARSIQVSLYKKRLYNIVKHRLFFPVLNATRQN